MGIESLYTLSDIWKGITPSDTLGGEQNRNFFIILLYSKGVQPAKVLFNLGLYIFSSTPTLFQNLDFEITS